MDIPQPLINKPSIKHDRGGCPPASDPRSKTCLLNKRKLNKVCTSRVVVLLLSAQSSLWFDFLFVRKPPYKLSCPLDGTLLMFICYIFLFLKDTLALKIVLFRSSEYLFGVLFLHYVIYFCSEATTPGYFVRPYIRPWRFCQFLECSYHCRLLCSSMLPSRTFSLLLDIDCAPLALLALDWFHLFFIFYLAPVCRICTFTSCFRPLYFF